ncbi:serine hydrolase [Cohnella sp. REN36]|uniref:serine hydrolase domain-containing protein n=1 Tax=Cohnella sp. REN36 TaxID=2887347 RepID=UPI001D143D4D|nr:serine hydrolase domain-containing protein [Cohnella sp. REN36]MCC3371582.1 beta-lactamase family protein [Cohnella sp. REN36]
MGDQPFPIFNGAGLKESACLLEDYASGMRKEIGATAAAICLVQHGRPVYEWYEGTHDENPDSRPVDARSQFNVGSVRKTYLALAVSLLIEQKRIRRLDDPIAAYLPEYGNSAAGSRTLRHLLTHTHGLSLSDGRYHPVFEPGTRWAYGNAGIALLFELVGRLTDSTLSEFVQCEILGPAELRETGWRTAKTPALIYNDYDRPDPRAGPNDSAAGDQSNLFATARDLAGWGLLHLRKGVVGGRQALPAAAFDRATALQTPSSLPANWPRHGLIWWLQADVPRNEIGDAVPPGSYQTLGITGCACLVIPAYDAVVVRMYNQLENPPGYDYLQDIRTFGNKAAVLLRPGR